jgi:hypothetical protein
MKCNDHPLSILASVPAGRLKTFAELLVPKVGAIEVIQYGTLIAKKPQGPLAQLTRPCDDDLSMVEARVYLSDLDVEGYGARMGRDTECALALAVIDAAFRCGIAPADMDRFLRAEAEARV